MTGADSAWEAPEVRPLRLTLEERTVVPVTACCCCEEELRACWPEEVEELPEAVTFLVLWLLLERAVEELLTAEPLPVEPWLLWEERTVVPLCCCLAAELLELLLPEERVTVLPLEREVLVLPEEREVLVLPEERRLSCCCTALLLLLRVVELLWERETLLPEEELLPEERVTALPLERELLLELLLPEEREVLVLPLERVVLLPPEERDCPIISGAMSMARASIMEVAKMENLLIASQF